MPAEDKARIEPINQYLTFRLSEEHYGVDILRVQEIRGWEAVTRIPNSQQYVKGVINLRGAIVPIYDMRLRFHMPFQDYSKNTVVIVVRVKKKGGEKHIGIVVDEVSDVVDTRPSEVTRAPDFGASIPTEMISGLFTSNDQMLILLDVDKMLKEQKVEMLEVQAAKG